MPCVAVVKIDGDLLQAVSTAIGLLGRPNISRGDRVLIKPNIVYPRHYSAGEITNPFLVEALIRWCYDQGAKEVVIGECPGYYQPRGRSSDCFTKTGFQEVAERSGARWVVCDDWPYKTFKNLSSSLPPVFSISEWG